MSVALNVHWAENAQTAVPAIYSKKSGKMANSANEASIIQHAVASVVTAALQARSTETATSSHTALALVRCPCVHFLPNRPTCSTYLSSKSFPTAPHRKRGQSHI